MKLKHKQKHYTEKYTEQACIDSWIHSFSSYLFLAFWQYFE